VLVKGPLSTNSAAMVMVKKLFSQRWVQVASGCALGAGLIVGAMAWNAGYGLADLARWWAIFGAYLAVRPWLFFIALVFLPGLPIPTSAMLFMAGVIWRQQPVMACGLCLVAMGLNLTWTYWLAAGPGRGLVQRVLAVTGYQIPDLPGDNHLKLILVLKLTPGVPFFVQNYLLGFLRAPFRLYLILSLICNGIIGSGVVLSGAGLADGKLLPALSGISLVILSVVLTQLLRGWLAKRKKAAIAS
jgi:uncharacterized membrane protein YdjX (TVP38/TMEM64 family)